VHWAAETFGDRTYVRPAEPGLAPITFDGLGRFVRGFGRWLDDHGTAPGDAVATAFHNSTLAALLFLGVIANRRVLVPLDPNLATAEMNYVLKRSEPTLMLYDEAIADRLPEVAGAAPVADQLSFVDRMKAMDGLWPGGRADSGRDAEIVFTSGSTGAPKGVVLSHRALLSDSFALGGLFGFTGEESFLTVCPLFHNSGQLFTTLTPLWCGGRTTAVRSDVAMLRFWRTVAEVGCDWTLVFSAYLALLTTKAAAEARPSKLAGVLSGGSRLDGQSIERFESAIGVPMYQVYGLTETSITTCEPPDRTGRVAGSAGQPLPICQVRIVADGVPAREGQRGEIEIRGENMLTRYYRAPELTAEKLRNGWLRTGDLGLLEGGNLFVVDRADNTIVVGSENVHPSEVEDLVPELEGVEEAVLTSVRHPVAGRELVLVYRSRAGEPADHAAWLAVLRSRLAGSKVPRRLVPITDLGVDALPRAANGKVLRERVAELVATSIPPGRIELTN
jgi:acyl-CoA synthetase (AMP-forming)/AMP-acid ligase II